MEAAMKHIRMILINGPKRVGKTTNANLVADMIGRSLPDGCRAHRINMADRLKTLTNSIYNVRTPDGQIAPPDYLEAIKDQPLEIFGGASFRQALIYVSEVVIKPRHGKTVFGKWFLDTVNQVCKPGDVVITADTGFASEIVPIINQVGGDNALLVRIHGMDASFDGDSRSYVHWKHVLTFKDDTNAPFRIGDASVRPDVLARGGFREIDVTNELGFPERSAQAVLDYAARANWLVRPTEVDLELAKGPTP